MRRLLRKDLIREVKKSFARFMSIAILIAMGTTFFIGLNSAAPTMLETANTYFKKNHYQDIKVTAPVEFNLEDVQKIVENERIRRVRLGYQVQALIQPGNSVIEVMSFSGQKDGFKLVEGRYPEKSGELALDSKGGKTYQLGEEVKFKLADGKEEPSVKANSYKVVGLVESTRYISKNARGTSSIGEGSVELFGLIREMDFTQEAPNSIEIELVSKIRKKNLYSTGYESDLAEAKNAVEKIVKVKVAERSQELVLDLTSQEKELLGQQSELEKQQKNLEKELKDISGTEKDNLRKEQESALATYEEGKTLLTEHRTTLATLKNRLLILEGAVTSETKRLESVANQIDSQRETLNQLLIENDATKAGMMTSLEGSYQQLVSKFQQDQGLQQIEIGKLAEIRTQFLTMEQLVQGETTNLLEAGGIKEKFASLEKQRADGQKKMEENLVRLNDSITDLKRKHHELQQNIKKSETIGYKVQGIDDTETFTSFKENVERLGIISQVIPFVFFFVAFIITSTLVLRMIDQSREQIGTLLALGINRHQIIKKYTRYTLISSSIGLMVGIYFGGFGLSQVVIGLYSPMYNFTNYRSYLYPQYLMISLLASLISVVIIPYFVYSRLFKLPALQLIKPQIANGGHPLLIERIPALWQKFPFFLQRTIRNIASYKVRMGVLLIGFVGCMSLLFISYGARDSVDKLQTKQFYDVFKHDVSVGRNQFTTEEETNAYLDYFKGKQVQRLPVLQEKWESLQDDKERVETFLISPKESNQLNHYIDLTDVASSKSLTLGKNDVFVTEKLANLFDLKVGDSWKIINSDGKIILPKVTKIVKNYYLHYVYIGEEAYHQLMGQSANYDRDFLLAKDWTHRDSKKILEYKAVSNLRTRDRDIAKMEEMTVQLNNLIGVMIVAAVLLGLVVLYNLAYITILERKQEIAVMRVMGYRQKKVTRYIFREILLLGLMSIVIGSVTGIFLHQLVMEQVELEFLFFPQIDTLKVFGESALTLLVITSLLVVLMHSKVKQINTVEALKVKE